VRNYRTVLFFHFFFSALRRRVAGVPMSLAVVNTDLLKLVNVRNTALTYLSTTSEAILHITIALPILCIQIF
jgi:hypothetical protein